MLKVADRVQETTNVAGFNNILLQGALGGYRSMSEAFNHGDQIPYVISKGINYEIGIGTLISGTPWELSRDTINVSSNGNQKIDVEAEMFIFVDSTAGFLEELRISTDIDYTVTWGESGPANNAKGDIWVDITNGRVYKWSGLSWQLIYYTLPFAWPNEITSTEIEHLDGVTSNIQTSITSMSASASNLQSQIDTIYSVAASGGFGSPDEIPFTWPETITDIEVGYLDGLTENIQTQLGDIAAALTSINGE